MNFTNVCIKNKQSLIFKDTHLEKKVVKHWIERIHMELARIYVLPIYEVLEPGEHKKQASCNKYFPRREFLLI